MTTTLTPYETNVTLLEKVRQEPTDQAAWSLFVRQYGRMIQNWFRNWGMETHDAEDLSQKVLLQLSQKMADFQYNPRGSFRAWLKTIAYRTWCDSLARRRRTEQGTGDPRVLEMLESTAARDDVLHQREGDWRRELLAYAKRTVESRVQPHTWQAFRLMSEEGLKGQDVAERLGMNVGAVWVARSKVQKMIADEVRRRIPSEG